MSKVAISGGPADGMVVTPAGRFAWLEVVVQRRSVRTDNAALYELSDGQYRFVGGRRTVCSCGAIVSKPDDSDMHEPCGICGADVTRGAS